MARLLLFCVLFCLVTKLCLVLCDSMDSNLPGSYVHGISQAKILEWVAIFFSGDLPDPGVESASPALAGSGSLPLNHLGRLNSCIITYL